MVHMAPVRAQYLQGPGTNSQSDVLSSGWVLDILVNVLGSIHYDYVQWLGIDVRTSRSPLSSCCDTCRKNCGRDVRSALVQHWPQRAARQHRPSQTALSPGQTV